MQEMLETILYQVFRFNPAVTVLELRTRLRGSRPFFVLFFFALIAGGALAGGFAVWGFSRSHGGPGMSGGGMSLLILAYAQQSLIYLIMPAYAGASIALEREKRTIGLLHTSLLTPTDIVSGKLVTHVAFAGVLLLATLPVAVWCLMLGGVSPLQVFMLYTYLLVLAVDVIAAALLISTMADRAMPAVVMTYGLFYIGGGMLSILPMALFGLSSMRGGTSSSLGTGGAVVLMLLVAALLSGTAYLVGLGVRRRFPALRAPRGAVLPTAAAMVAGVAALVVALRWLPTVSSWSVQTLMLTSPRMAIGAMLNAVGTPFGASGTNMPPAVLIWLLNLGLGAAVAAFLWLLAIANYRRRSEIG